MIKAIETEYKGHRFRSRQEARWAVFFDSLGVSWEYEKEGYELESGRYLPDFWLPTLDCFFEVKGYEPSEEEIAKAVDLSQSTSKLVAIAIGQTKTEPIKFSNIHIEWPSDGFQIKIFAGHSACTWECRSFDFGLWNWMLDTDLPPFILDQFPQVDISGLSIEERRKLLIECDREYYKNKHGKEHPRYVYGRYVDKVYFISDSTLGLRFANEPEHEPSKVSQAYASARGARFEFGESGA